MQSIFKNLTEHVSLLNVAQLVAVSALLCSCASAPKVNEQSQEFIEILEYRNSLPEGHDDSYNSVVYLSSEIRDMVRANFRSSSKHRSARKLAQWLMQSDGHNMKYDISANLSPAEAFRQKRANCLSFSLLLIALAKELNIELELNQVDLPDVWGEDDDQDLVFYRHVNVVYESLQKTQIFDLALQDYRLGFPQRIINERDGTALLFSNIGIQQLQSGNHESALHYLKLSASLFPKNADMWINLGAAYKRNNDLLMAEQIYLKAFSISDQNSLAASNLERIYRNRGDTTRARFFEKRAKHARLRNPYVQYRLAQSAFNNRAYGVAGKAIKRAIKLHDSDPEFFELSSRIKQAKYKYVSAVKDLQKAYELSHESLERGRYEHKVKMVVARAKAYAEEQNERQQKRQGYRTISPEAYRGATQTF